MRESDTKMNEIQMEDGRMRKIRGSRRQIAHQTGMEWAGLQQLVFPTIVKHPIKMLLMMMVVMMMRVVVVVLLLLMVVVVVVMVP